MSSIKTCQWLDLKCGPFVSQATALPSEPQPLPCKNKFLSSSFFVLKRFLQLFRFSFSSCGRHILAATMNLSGYEDGGCKGNAASTKVKVYCKDKVTKFGTRGTQQQERLQTFILNRQNTLCLEPEAGLRKKKPESGSLHYVKLFNCRL